MSDDDDKGGFVFGGIGFGSGPQRPPHNPIEVDGVVLPMRLLVLGDFVGRGEFNAGINPPEHPVTVQAAELAPLFASLAPRLSLEIESVMHEGAKARVDVVLSSMLSFRPDALCQNVSVLRSLVDGKKVLERLRDGSLNVDAAATELARLWQGSPMLARVLGGVELSARPQAFTGAVATPSQSDDAADRILDMLDLGSEPAQDSEAPTRVVTGSRGGRFDSFLATVAHSGKSAPGARPDEGIRIIEQALGMQLAAIVQHPEFRRLEEAWRGLAFLVGRMPKSGVRLDVLSCRTGDAPSALRLIASAGIGITPPVTLAVVDGVVGRDAASLLWLRELAEAAQENAVVALTNASPALFGAELAELDRLDNPQGLFDAPARAPWRAEAHRPAALWVSLALNRILVRTAYDTKSSRVRDAAVAELPAGEDAVVWMQPAWVVASLAAKSHARYEWPCGITGARDGGLVDNLPVREVTLSNGERIAMPTEAFLSTETQRALGRSGLLALASQPNSDSAYLMSAATAYVPPPKRTYDGGADDFDQRLPQASLNDQLFVARLAQQLEWLGQRIVRDGHTNDAKKHIEAGLAELFRNAPPSGPEIDLQLADDSATVTIRPRRFLGVTLEEVSLRVPLR